MVLNETWNMLEAAPEGALPCSRFKHETAVEEGGI